MSETSTSSTAGPVTLQVNTIALIAGISVIGTILLLVVLIACGVWCSKMAKRRRQDRSRQYMVHDGASPYSSVHGPSSGGVPSYNGMPRQWGSSYFLATGYENKAVDVNEFRPNPLAENPFPRQPSLLNQPPNISEYNVDPRYNSPRYTQSTQSLNFENDSSFYASLYEKLGDTTHKHQGRPLYVCKREHYQNVSEHFDIIGKTRTNDWLIRPRKTTPNRPQQRKSSKKQKAPKPGNAQDQRHQASQGNTQIGNGYLIRPGANAKITTPFGAAERMPARYDMSQRNADGSYEAGFSSLPRDGKLHNGRSREGNQLRRQASSSAADRPARRLDEQQYAQVMKKNALNGVSAGSFEKKNPSRRQISTIEEIPHVTPKTANKNGDTADGATRERSGSVSTVKSFGKNIADQFQFLDQYETEEERF